MTLTQDRDHLLARSDLRGHAFADTWRAEVDRWLADRVTDATGAHPDPGVALVAVGGYGRGDLAPGSDLDLLLLHRRGVDPAELAEAIWYPIWDEGLKLGHAVRTVGDALDLAAGDLDTATSLLSVRHLAGDRELTEELAGMAATQWRKDARRNLGRLLDSVAERHPRQGEVAFLLEPDLKEGRGGLRDVQALRWAEAARSVLLPGDADRLAEAERTLFDVRVELHRGLLTAGRGVSERLSLQDQDDVAKRLGTDADALMAEIAVAARTVAWIGDESWYRVKRTVSTSRSLLGWRSRDRAPGLVVREGQVQLEPTADPAQHPELVLDVAALAAGKDARISRETLARLADRAPAPPEVWPADLRDRFVGLLACGRPAIGVIEALDHGGLWARYLPEWDNVRHRPQRNAYHRFTVDRHLLEATANAAALADRVDRPDLLLLGALLHDIGKGVPGDHTEVGMELVATIGPRMGLTAEDTAVVVDLVRHHLLLPDVATRRDLTDRATIASVADAVGDRGRLHLLAALTEADSLATGPAAWGPWKAELVADLVRRVDHHLGGGTQRALAVSEFPDAAQRALLAAGETVVQAEGEQVVLVAPDRSGLVSRVAGVLALHGLEVRTADAFAQDGMAVEQFRVSSRFGPLIDWDRVEVHIRAVIAGRLALDARLAERVRIYGDPAPGRHLPPPTVRFDDAASAAATVVEIQAPDRFGLLYRVTRAFGELDLDVRVAKVQTLGDQVVDAFYVTHRDGSLVTDPAVRAELERSLLHAVG